MQLAAQIIATPLPITVPCEHLRIARALIRAIDSTPLTFIPSAEVERRLAQHLKWDHEHIREVVSYLGCHD